MATDRPRFRIYLDEDTVDLWHDFCAVTGLTMSALGEGFGRLLDPALEDPFLERVVAEGRRVMHERNDHRRPD